MLYLAMDDKEHPINIHDRLSALISRVRSPMDLVRGDENKRTNGEYRDHIQPPAAGDDD